MKVMNIMSQMYMSIIRMKAFTNKLLYSDNTSHLSAFVDKVFFIVSRSGKRMGDQLCDVCLWNAASYDSYRCMHGRLYN